MNDGFWRALMRLNVRALFLITVLILAAIVFWAVIRSEPTRPAKAPGPEKAAGAVVPVEDRLPVEFIPPPEHRENPFVSDYLTETVRREKERLQRLEEERKAAEERKRLEEEAARKAAEEAARLAAEKEARRRAELEAARKTAEEDAARKAAEEEAKRLAAEEAARQAAQAEATQAETPVAAQPPPPASPPKRTRPPRPPGPPRCRFVYRGLMTRTDGVTVAILEDQTNRQSGYYKEGDSPLEGYSVGTFSWQQLKLKAPDDTVIEVAIGEAVTLTGKTPE